MTDINTDSRAWERHFQIDSTDPLQSRVLHHGSWFSLGYTPIPIVPPEAADELAPNCRFNPEELGKLPGRKTRNGWSGFNWVHHTPTHQECVRWTCDGAGVGLRLGQALRAPDDDPRPTFSTVALDIDVTDPRLARVVSETIQRTLDCEPAERVGSWPKRLVLLRVSNYPTGGITPHKIWIKQAKDTDTDTPVVRHCVELRGRGQQVVVSGIHPKTGRPYRWSRDPLEKMESDAIPTVSVNKLRRLLDEIVEELQYDGERTGQKLEIERNGKIVGGESDRSQMDQGHLKGHNLDDLESAVQALPNRTKLFPTRDDWVKVGHAIKAGFADDPDRGLSVWRDWSARWEDGHNDPADVDANWDRFQPPFAVGANWLYEQARIHGGYNDGPARGFTPIDEDKPAVAMSDVSALIADVWTAEDGIDLPPLTGVEFFDRYLYAVDMKRWVDLMTGKLLDADQFNREWVGEVGESLSGKDSPMLLWLSHQHGKARKVQSPTYRPGAPLLVHQVGGQDDRRWSQILVNLYQPGPAHRPGGWLESAKEQGRKATDEDVKQFLDLARALVPDAGERETLLNWMAHQIQSPGEKCNWHPLMIGEPGVGKDTLFLPLLSALGDNGRTVSADVLLRPWTGFLANAALVVLEEVHSFERRSIMDKIKPWFANPPLRIDIEEKHQPAYPQDNVVNFVAFSNHDDAMAIEDKDRRVFVIKTAAKQGHWGEWEFLAYYAWLQENGGAEAVTLWLNQRDLSAFNTKGHAPMTDAKQEMAALNTSPWMAAIREGIADQAGPFARKVTTVKAIKDWLVAEGACDTRLGAERISHEVRRHGAVRPAVPVKVDGKAVRVLVLRDPAVFTERDAEGRLMPLGDAIRDELLSEPEADKKKSAKDFFDAV